MLKKVKEILSSIFLSIFNVINIIIETLIDNIDEN